jgi:very-short-patch-repair endonuclease
VRTSVGTFYVDGLWRALAKGLEIDGRAFHLDAGSWARDLSCQNAIQTAGVVLLRIPARRLWADPSGVLDDLRAFLGW